MMWTKIFAIVVLGSFFVGAAAHAGPDDEAYFEQFLYRADPGPDPDYPSYTYHLLDSDVPGTTPINSTQQIVVTTSIEMNADHTFTMLYNDGIGDIGAISWKIRNCNQIKGTWSVPDKSLILVDDKGTPIFQGDRLYINGQNEIMITYLDGFFVSELRGKQNSYGYAQSSNQPSMTCLWP